LQSITGRQGVAYRYVILLVLSRTFPKKQQHKPPKFAVVDNPTVIWLIYPCDRQTEGRTGDSIIHAIAYMLSRAKTLKLKLTRKPS